MTTGPRHNKTQIDHHVPVLVVGAGGAGLSASIMLSGLGIRSLTVERYPGTSIHAKAHILNPRTMEIFAQLGVADDIYREGTPSRHFQATTWYTSLGGDDPWDRRIFFRADSWGGGKLADFYAGLSPNRHANLTQMWLEPLLRRHADSCDLGEVRFGTELVELEQHVQGVTATLVERASGRRFAIGADYVIAADGGKTIGPLLGLEMQGSAAFMDMVTVHFRADLAEYLQEDDSVIRLIARPTMDGGWKRGGLVALGPDRWDRECRDWRVGVAIRPGDERPKEYSASDAVEDVRNLLKLPELEIEVVSLAHWLVENVLVERYRTGRVFLVGDAAHRHSPMGGLGLNTAVQDVHNLTWKLASVLNGVAGDELLESYEDERRPVAARNIDFATFAFYNHIAISAGFGLLPDAPLEHNRAAFETLFNDNLDGAMRWARLQEIYGVARYEFQAADVELGFEYGASRAVLPDGTEPPPRDPVGHVYVQTGRPGHRFPHTWLWTTDGRRVSTHDLLSDGAFLVLAGQAGQNWVEAANRCADQLGVSVSARWVGDSDLEDRTDSWRSLRGHDDGGVLLVRPDGHVAYRSLTASPDAHRDLHQALTTVLLRGSSSSVLGDAGVRAAS